MKFWRRGVSNAYFVPTIADTSSPTTAEITAGTPLSNCVSDISGFETSQSDIPAPTLGSRTTAQIPGEKTFGTPTMTLYEDDGQASTDSAELAAAYTALADDATGYIILAPGSAASTKKVEVWPVKISANNRQWSVGNDPAGYVVSFSVTDVPDKNATVAA